MVEWQHCTTNLAFGKLTKQQVIFSKGTCVADYEYENHICQWALVFPQF